MNSVDKRITRESASTGSAVFYQYRFANVEFDESRGVLRLEGQEVEIEPRPLGLLAELLHRPNEVVSKDELLEILWEGRPTVENVLANAVTKLRKALGPQAADRIVTLPRMGYKFGGPLERVAAGQRDGVDLALVAGQCVPGRTSYRLVASLGRAGADQVWLARDPKLQQDRVFKFAADSASLTALKREYTLYRVLRTELGERDDFARVVSANFSEAPYFIECEYGGQDLLAWAAEEGRLGAMPLPERVALFLQIARAVAAAHGVGVLHKDLKPANVLVAGHGAGWAVKLTDFGNSRLMEPGRLEELGVTALGMTLTQGVGTGSQSGTPLYLAPELLAGQAPSTQSDLYALGLMLYQLLVGNLRRPLSTGWERGVSDELLRADIRAATEGEPSQRLGSVAELVERLSTLERRRASAAELADAARRAEAAQLEVQKARQRRPWLALAFASLAVGLGTSLWFFREERLALHESQQQAARAQSINDFLNKGVLLSADMTGLGPDKAPTMREVLSRASADAAQRFRADPVTEASVRLTLGDVHNRMSNLSAAEAEYRRAMTLLAPSARADAPDYLRARFALSTVLANESKLADAAQVLESALKDAGPGLATARSEVALEAASARFANLVMHQRYRESVEPGQRMVALADALFADEPQRSFRIRFKLADAYVRLGRFSDAEALLAQLGRAPYTPEIIGEAMYARARIQWARVRNAAGGSKDGVEAALTGSRDTLQRLMGPQDVYIAIADAELANLYDAQGDLVRSAEALEAQHKALAATLGEQHQSTQIALLNLAINAISIGRPRQGLEQLDRARPWFVQNMGGELSPVTQAIDFQRARALSLLGRPREAAELLNTLSPTLLAEADPAPDWQWRLQAEKARSLILMSQHDSGVALLRAAVSEMEAQHSAPRTLAEYRAVLASAAGGRMSHP